VEDCGDALRSIGGEIKTLVYTKESANLILAHIIL